MKFPNLKGLVDEISARPAAQRAAAAQNATSEQLQELVQMGRRAFSSRLYSSRMHRRTLSASR